MRFLDSPPTAGRDGFSARLLQERNVFGGSTGRTSRFLSCLACCQSKDTETSTSFQLLLTTSSTSATKCGEDRPRRPRGKRGWTRTATMQLPFLPIHHLPHLPFFFRLAPSSVSSSKPAVHQSLHSQLLRIASNASARSQPSQSTLRSRPSSLISPGCPCQTHMDSNSNLAGCPWAFVRHHLLQILPANPHRG